MLNAFEVYTAHLVVCDLSLQLKIALEVFNDLTHDCLVPQPLHISKVVDRRF